MKYRIIQTRYGQYYAQRRNWFFMPWRFVGYYGSPQSCSDTHSAEKLIDDNIRELNYREEKMREIRAIKKSIKKIRYLKPEVLRD